MKQERNLGMVTKEVEWRQAVLNMAVAVEEAALVTAEVADAATDTTKDAPLKLSIPMAKQIWL